MAVALFSLPIVSISPNSASTVRSVRKSNCSDRDFNFAQEAIRPKSAKSTRKSAAAAAAAAMFSDNTLTSDLVATGLSGVIALSLLKFWEKTAKMGVDQKLNRKLVHITVGSTFMLCWPMFSVGNQGALFAALIPIASMIKVGLIGLGIWKDEATVKSMSRYGDHRELLKGPLYYGATIALSGIIYWKKLPIAIAAICNLCAGDGMADIVGRRFGRTKLPYNENKSLVGSLAMASAGFLASIGYMWYFSMMGYFEGSREMGFGFLMVSIAAALVESHPVSTMLDDNLTVPLTSLCVATLLF